MDRPASHSSSGRTVMHLDRALARMGGDRSLLVAAARFFLEDSVELLANVSKGLNTRDFKLAARGAHSIRGLSANFNADTCVAIAEAVESACERQDVDTATSLVPVLEGETAHLIAALKHEFPDIV